VKAIGVGAIVDLEGSDPQDEALGGYLAALVPAPGSDERWID